MQKLEVLVISIASPILVGIYKDGNLKETMSMEGMTSDTLPIIFDKLLKKYIKLDAIYYVNGPGSYMAIKVAYIFLKSIAITKNIPLYATKGFAFNGNTPIKALGKKYFFNSLDGTIKIGFLKEGTILQKFSLPQILDKKIFNSDNIPSYNLPVV